MKYKNKTGKQLISKFKDIRGRTIKAESSRIGEGRMENVYKHFFDLSNDMLCIAGLDGYFKLLNFAFEETLGYTREELRARPYYDFIHPEDRARNCKKKNSIRGNPSVICCENRFLCKNGSYKWLSWTEYKDVEEGLIYAVVRDITDERQAKEALQKAHNELDSRVRERTEELMAANEELMAEIYERKKIEKALQENEERYRILFEESPIAFWEKDFSEIKKHIDALKANGIKDFRTYFKRHPEKVAHLAPLMKIVDANKTMVDLYKAKSKEEFLTDIVKVFLDETYDLFRGELLAIADGKLIHEGEGITQTFTGEKNHITIKWAVPRGHRKTFSKVLVSVIDITARVQMEEESRLMQKKLLHTNKMTALGTLVSGIAHEINNPNSFILSNTEMLSDIWNEVNDIVAEYCRQNPSLSTGTQPLSELDEVIPNLLSGISDGAYRIKGIIDNLRDLARPDRASMDETVDVNKVIMASRSILNNQIKKSTDNFTIRCHKNIPPVKGNSQQIEQVIINILMNSLQALPNRNCGVSISTSFSKKSDCVKIKVRDEGVGISSDIYERIKEPFFTTKFESGGTGLGLSISYNIIKKHHGTLRIKSEPGEGTTATVTLPKENTF